MACRYIETPVELTPGIRSTFETLGLLAFETLPDDHEMDWHALAAPLWEAIP